MKITELLTEGESKTLFKGNALPKSDTSTVLILYKVENGDKKPVAKYSTVSSAYDMLNQLESEYPDDEYGIEWKHDYPKTMYESDSSHNPIGVNNWNEIKRAMKYRGPESDALHNARLKFDDVIIPLTKESGDLYRISRWAKNHLGNNEQDLVFNKLGSIMALDKLVQSMKPPKIKEDNDSRYEDNSKVWMLTYTGKNKSREINKLFFKHEDDALQHRTKLEDNGYEVYTPTRVSSRTMTAKDKLR